MSVSSHDSSSLEKLLEHHFLADLTTALWRRGERQIEVLRSEVDHAGYDIVLEVGRILRHIQLKARRRGGKRREVSLNVRLSAKPSGCVVWMDYDPETLELGPFLWFGGAPGEPLPDLGGTLGRHTKGNKDGTKLPRPDQRVVKDSAFTRLTTIDAVVERLFGSFRAASSAEELARLRTHLRQRAAETPLSDTAPDWLRQAQSGEFRAIPAALRYEDSSELAHLIDGYQLVKEAGLGDYDVFLQQRTQEARRTGAWTGSALELWVLLFLQHRCHRFEGSWANTADLLYDALCRSLRDALVHENQTDPVA